MAAMFYEENDSINRFLQVTYMTLCSSGSVPLQRLEGYYLAMESSMHEKARSTELDINAFSYVYNRLPNCIFNVKDVFFGQSESYLKECGIPIDKWAEVFAVARRRRYLYDGKSTLVAFIASKSDLDDLIPSLLAFQLEWNKLNKFLANNGEIKEDSVINNLSQDDVIGLKNLFKSKYVEIMNIIKNDICDLNIKNYEASFCRYKRETEIWWKHIFSSCPELENRPIYFVSSNTHSLINIVSGFAEYHEEEILSYAQSNEALKSIASKYVESAENEKNSILYYLMMKWENSYEGNEIALRKFEWEKSKGIIRIKSNQTLDVSAQIIDIKKLVEATKNLKVGFKIPSELASSDALIFNIDYPLGRTAYFILSKLAEHITSFKGIYVIGKAASLFADRGDVLIPSFIACQHTRNQYYFENCITTQDVIAFIDDSKHGIYDNQRAVTVLGTFLQNSKMLDQLVKNGITDLEMEAGPYLSALYEIINAKRYPENDNIIFNNQQLDIGIIHYVSDNPFSDAKLSSSLATDGIDATYASTMVVLDKIIKKEQLI